MHKVAMRAPKSDAAESARQVFHAVLDADSGVEPVARTLAARGCGKLLDAGAVPLLGPCLSHVDEDVQAAAAAALERITAHRFDTGKAGAAAFGQWWAQNKGSERIPWVMSAFEAGNGIRLTPKTWRKAVRKLVSLVRKGGRISANARALIAHFTGYRAHRRNPRAMHRAYRRWLRRGGARKTPAAQLFATR